MEITSRYADNARTVCKIMQITRLNRFRPPSFCVESCRDGLERPKEAFRVEKEADKFPLVTGTTIRSNANTAIFLKYPSLGMLILIHAKT